MSHAHHDHAGHHHHHHQGGAPDFQRAFAIGVGLNLVYVAAEAGYGFAVNSLSLLADAGHNLGDVAGLLLAWWAAWLGQKRPTSRRTYGYGRASILAALGNAMLLLAAIGAISWEAVHRLYRPEPVQGGIIMAVAGLGIVVNTATALLFLRGRKSDLNVRGAFLHMAADAAVSLGVVLAGGAILATGWLWLDPAVSLVVALVIALSTWGLLKDSTAMAVDAVPAHVDRDAVEAYLRSIAAVEEVHDLHIWPLSTTSVALTAHLVRREDRVDDRLTLAVAEELKRRFGIDHATLQFETGALPCHLEPDHVV
jgi:cobalt-zinc-cadmium efflux system protein